MKVLDMTKKATVINPFIAMFFWGGLIKDKAVVLKSAYWGTMRLSAIYA
jgi:hypothetical protein